MEAIRIMTDRLIFMMDRVVAREKKKKCRVCPLLPSPPPPSVIRVLCSFLEIQEVEGVRGLFKWWLGSWEEKSRYNRDTYTEGRGWRVCVSQRRYYALSAMAGDECGRF